MAETFDYQGYHLTFRDEFNTFNRVEGDTGTWQTKYWWGRTKGEEQQFYIDKTVLGPDNKPLGIDPFSVNDGVLTIEAKPSPADMSIRPWIGDRPYTSGVITTHDVFTMTYGYVEMRAQLPAGQGLWPAFWMLPADKTWPPEIDMMEMMGYDPNTLHVTAHTNKTGVPTYETVQVPVPDLSKGFHTYGMEWTAQTITWYFDGQKVGQVATPPDMHKPMYLIANLAMGNPWPGYPDETTPWPAKYNIDYIRVYEEAAPHSSQPGPVTGAAPTNTILGTNAANVINGTSGHDRIDGKAGANTMAGKGGSDTYVVETMGDKVVEYSGQGIDTVFSSLGFRLGAYMENLTLTGTANVNGTGSNWHNHLTGNDGANALYGLGGNDRLTGGKGADVLTGGAGHDTFVFRSKADAGDRILDFDTAHDRLDVRQLLASIGSTSKDPLADNLLAIRQEGADAVLMVTQPGTQAVRLATVEKVDAHLLAATSDHWTV